MLQPPHLSLAQRKCASAVLYIKGNPSPTSLHCTKPSIQRAQRSFQILWQILIRCSFPFSHTDKHPYWSFLPVVSQLHPNLTGRENPPVVSWLATFQTCLREKPLLMGDSGWPQVPTLERSRPKWVFFLLWRRHFYRLRLTFTGKTTTGAFVSGVATLPDQSRDHNLWSLFEDSPTTATGSLNVLLRFSRSGRAAVFWRVWGCLFVL